MVVKILKTDYKRGVEIARAAIEMKEQRRYPFNQPDIFPDAIVPEGVKVGSLEHALFLFYACNFDSSQRAVVVYDSLRQIASKIDLTLLALMPPKEILKVFKPYMKKMGDPERALLDPINTAHHNAIKLQQEYGGDPRNLRARTVQQTIDNICHGKTRKYSAHKFRQYGIGKAALLMKNYVRFGMWDFSPYEIPIKVDRHLLRISVGSRVAILQDESTRGRMDRVVDALTKLYQKVTLREKISAVDLNDSFWAIGSYLCTRNNAINCHLSCDINCLNRPDVDKKLTWYYPKSEHRRDAENLFSYAKCK
ncbi:MAG: hypothetical protein AABX17_04165 [Nanoarchaeota archaeon]